MNEKRYEELAFKDGIIEQFDKVINVLGFFNKWSIRYIAISVVLSYFNIVDLPFVTWFVYVLAIGIPLGVVVALSHTILISFFKSNNDYKEYKHMRITRLMNAFFGEEDEKRRD